ncbi:MAG: hypothetical protein K6A43_07970 [Treponema sp.]|nr:hypothetical protein [Treponema sp.]
MARDVLSIAWSYMQRRKFASAIKLMEGRSEIYEENFEYNLLLGISCLYVGDIGSASSYFQRARHIKLTDTRLLLGQAAIFLRRGDTDRALQYYMDVKENDPANKTANAAMEFIRTHGDYDTICRYVDTGRIEAFYPPLGPNPQKIARFVIPCAAFMLGVGLVLCFVARGNRNPAVGQRMDLTELSLSDDEKRNPQEKDLSSQSFRYILSDKEINQAYVDVMDYFQSHRDNKAQIEINRILNSNASLSIRTKSQTVMNYLETPTFDTLTDNPTYTAVEADPYLYMDCYVIWGGKITNAINYADGSYSCQLLVGYETGEQVLGIVTVKFDSTPQIQPDQPVKILGRITTEDKKVILRGRAVYQSVNDGLL